MSETDIKLSQQELDVPQDGNQEEPPRLLKLTGQQQALYEALLEKEKALPGKRLYLSPIYLGAITVLESEGNADKMAQAAHSIRELMEKIPAIVDVETKALTESLKSKVHILEDYWQNFLKNLSICSEKPSSHQIQEWIIAKFHKRLAEFFEWFKTHHPTRKAEIDETLYKLEGSEQSLPPVLRKLNVDYWDEMRNYFQAVAHHGRDTTVEEFKRFLAALEKFLLDRLSPRTFADFDEIDKIIKEDGSSG
jgi:hypothetical protein